MAVNVAGLLSSLGVNVTGLEAQATNFLLARAAEWSRVPTRFRRVQSAIDIIKGAAAQRNNVAAQAQMSAAEGVLSQLQSAYDNASGDVADVVDVARQLKPGQAPPLDIVPKAAKAYSSMLVILKGLTGLEGQVMRVADGVLTPAEKAKLNMGMSFPLHMALQGGKFLLYAALAVPLYFFVTRKKKRKK